MSTLPERIQIVLDETGLEQTELADAAGATKGTVNQWLSRRIKKLRFEYAEAIEKKFGYSVKWLITGKGEKKVTEVGQRSEFDPTSLPGRQRIPVVGMTQLGDKGFWAEIESPVGHGDGYLEFPSREKAYGLRCKGDSMMPRIRDGEFVIVEPDHAVQSGDEVLIKAVDGRVMIKTFLYSRDGRKYFMSVNEEHGRISFEDAEIEQLHYVAAIVKASMWRPE
ncbi:LexA family transcriptional regulator [Paraburkholderia phenazinium]|jgi:phage repressor protein C with HTH and peptisase S24 domain|uniref:Phage repressor protein C, contains Cro/C1-type HTH and peptisase s24 domains n=1 Tax=Paraburkholderia phenazinium TaxID=60549 RepID=A0A1N6L0U0_9BURK|nr:S24 family peptidase [Paraburkholderia phenazinium]SIO62286.1 Phage repressor protein C, contains Cro/C1-type HTH and peptisase s24 domains [Paraburkholderia phenazinium]